jgi:signal transduction histidine kinase
MSWKKRWANGVRAGRYLLISIFTGIGQLGALLAPPLVRPILGWQLRCSADQLNADESARRPRRDSHGRWLASHAALSAAFGAALTAVAAPVVVILVFLGIWVDTGFRTLGQGDFQENLRYTVVGTVLLSALAGGLVVGMVARAIPRMADAHAKLSISLLSASAAERRAAELTQRVSVLTSTRAEALDAHSAELRRIERDLHDGAQAQLVALSMRLGMAEQRVATLDPETAILLREARSGAEEAMGEMRDVIRTMYPPILADRGLTGAISGLAARSIIPVNVHVSELGPLPAPVEAAAYFVVAESVTNAIKHSAATQILVRLDRSYDSLHLQVTDDGLGGAIAAHGTGLVGIQRRVAALDGATTIHSPIGGGTTITVELPCRQ